MHVEIKPRQICRSPGPFAVPLDYPPTGAWARNRNARESRFLMLPSSRVVAGLVWVSGLVSRRCLAVPSHVATAWAVTEKAPRPGLLLWATRSGSREQEEPSSTKASLGYLQQQRIRTKKVS